MKLTIEVTETQRDQILKYYPQKWRPGKHSKYWIVASTGEVISDIWQLSSVADEWRKFIGNCFETREEAEKHKAYLVALHTVRNAIEPGKYHIYTTKISEPGNPEWVHVFKYRSHSLTDSSFTLPLMSNAQHIIDTFPDELRLIFGVDK